MKRRVEWSKGRLDVLIDMLHEWPGRVLRAYRYTPQHAPSTAWIRAWNLPRVVVDVAAYVVR